MPACEPFLTHAILHYRDKMLVFSHPIIELKNVSIAKYKKVPEASKMSTHCSAPDVMQVIATSIVNTKYRRNLLMVKEFVNVHKRLSNSLTKCFQP